MQDFLSGVGFTAVIPLLKGNLPIVPTVGSVTYTLLDHAGLPITGQVDIPVVTTATTFELVIPLQAMHLTITAPKLFERRTLVASFTSNGKSQQFSLPFRLVPFLNHGLTPQDVREFIGIAKNELEDEGIDLTSAYFYVKSDITTTDLETLLTSGTITEIAARECIRMRAVIQVLPSLRQRMAQMESNGVLQFRRANLDKFEAMETQAWSAYISSRSTATGVEANTLTLMVSTLDTDALTGA